jgi:hypothetical protein
MLNPSAPSAMRDLAGMTNSDTVRVRGGETTVDNLSENV